MTTGKVDTYDKVDYWCQEVPNLGLTHLPLVLYIYVSVNQVIIGSDNGLSLIRRQAII